VEPGLDRPDGYPEGNRRFRQREPEEEAKDDHGPLLGFEPGEGAVKDVPVSDLGGRVRDRRMVERGQLHLDRPPASSPGQVEAGVDREAMEPWPDPVRVTQPGQVSPRSHERILDGVARELRVPEDEPGSRVQPREGGSTSVTKAS